MGNLEDLISKNQKKSFWKWLEVSDCDISTPFEILPTTLQGAITQKWLREDHELHIEPEFSFGTFSVTVVNASGDEFPVWETEPEVKTFDSYERALELGIKRSLSLI